MFSEKYGYKQMKKIQVKPISKELRNRIWNLFYQEEIKPYEESFLDDFLSGEATMEEKIVDKLGFSINSISPITDRGVLKQRSNDLPLESNVVTLYFPCTKKYI